jgi:chemotaxis protein methyltransferase WspC
VRFQQGNLFAADFCRRGDLRRDLLPQRAHLLRSPTQDRALGRAEPPAARQGVLFVAPAETALPASHGLVSTNEPLAFAFRKAAASARGRRRRPARRAAHSASAVRRARVPVAPAATCVPTARAAPARADPSDLTKPRLADQGTSSKRPAVRGHLRVCGSSATAFYLWAGA